MVKVTGGGRGMGAIAAHLRYIAKAGRLPIEDDRGAVREGKEALRAIADQWRLGGTCIPEVSERREAFNIMLSMPAGTDALALRHAAREFAKAELANHRYVLVQRTHQANPHVHISVRAEGRDGSRLNPCKEDLRWWRETFAERLRGLGIEAEASSQAVRGSRHHDERVWSRKRMQGRGSAAVDKQKPPRMPPSHRRAGEARVRTAEALAASPEPTDRDLSRAERASGHGAFTRPEGDADADSDAEGARNGTVGQSEGRVSSPPDGLGGWPLRSRQPDRQASMPGAPHQGCAGAGLRPPLTRPAARKLKASWPLRMQKAASCA